MIKKLFLTYLICISTLFGCTTNKKTVDEDINATTKDNANISTNNANNEILLGNSFSESNLTLTTNSIIPSKFLNLNNMIFFSNSTINGEFSSVTYNDINSLISLESVNVLSEHTVQSLTSIGDIIYFINTSDNNSIYKYDSNKNILSKELEGNFHEITSIGTNLIVINKSNNNSLLCIDTLTNTKYTLTSDKCGKYIINGDYILYQNQTDNCKLYSIKIDGTERNRVINSAIDSFVIYNNNILFISALDNDLYSFNIKTKNSNKLLKLAATDLKSLDNDLFFIDSTNSNRLCSISVDSSLDNLEVVWLTNDMVNEHYPTALGTFCIKPINPHEIFFLKY